MTGVAKKLVEINVAEKKIMITRDKNGKTVKVKLPPKRARERVLNDDEIQELVKFAELIEDHYGTPQDVEWGIEKGKVRSGEG